MRRGRERGEEREGEREGGREGGEGEGGGKAKRAYHVPHLSSLNVNEDTRRPLRWSGLVHVRRSDWRGVKSLTHARLQSQCRGLSFMFL